MTDVSPSRSHRTPSLLSAGRFVWLRHELPAGANRASHWDLMLEVSGALATWAFASALFSDRVGESRSAGAALRLADHRLAYLDYEGPISGGRGEVRRMDSGHYVVACRSTVTEFIVQLRGPLLRGELRMWLSTEERPSESARPEEGTSPGETTPSHEHAASDELARLDEVPWEWTWHPDWEIATRET